MTTNILQFLNDCSETLCLCALRQDSSSRANIVSGAERFKAVITDLANSTENLQYDLPKDYQRIAALQSLDTIPDTDDSPLVQHFKTVAPQLPWKSSFRMEDNGAQVGLCSINDMFEMQDIIAGFVYIDSHQKYPEHQHPPQELYLTISGNGQWRFGGAQDYVELTPNNTLYNHSMDLHGVHASHSPVVAMYVLWDL